MWYCVWRDGGKSVVVLCVEGEGCLSWCLFVEDGGRSVGVLCLERGERSVVVVVRGGGREVCCGIVRGEMEGGLLWCCTWRGRDVRCGDVFGGGR